MKEPKREGGRGKGERRARGGVWGARGRVKVRGGCKGRSIIANETR